MTQEQKENLLGKLAREKYGKLVHMRIFKEGAKSVLDNPGEWGLIHRYESEEHIKDSDSNWEDALSELKNKNKRYREALELIAMPKADRGDVELIAKEALKQQDND